MGYSTEGKSERFLKGFSCLFSLGYTVMTYIRQRWRILQSLRSSRKVPASSWITISLQNREFQCVWYAVPIMSTQQVN
jgi:hypothetical protein